MIDTDWMGAAACGGGTRADCWTSERQPTPGVLHRLSAVCVECPVRHPCALYALETEADCGMYAGVWLPSRGEVSHHRNNRKWLDARDDLWALIGEVA